MPSPPPSAKPTPLPTRPDSFKTAPPTRTFAPTHKPTHAPTATPTVAPTPFPTYAPTPFVSYAPTTSMPTAAAAEASEA